MKNLKIKSVIFLLVLSISFQLNAFNGDLRAIAKRPNKNELYVAGEFKTMLVLDSKTGKVKRTFLTENGARKLAFNKSGKLLIAEFDGEVKLLDPETGTVTKTITGSTFYLFNNGSYIVDLDLFGKKVNLYSSEDGELVLSQKCEFKPNFLIMGNNETEMHVFSAPEVISNELELITTKTVKAPSNDKYNMAYIREQADGKGVRFFTITIANKLASKVQTIPYSPMGCDESALIAFKDNLFLLSNESFYKTDKIGKTTPIAYIDDETLFAATSSNNGKYIVKAGSKNGFIFNCETEKFTPFSIGQPIFNPEAVDVKTENDTIYLLSNDYSLDVFTINGKVIMQTLINFESNKGKFAVVFKNTSEEKADRDKQTLSINKVLKTINAKAINLEVKEPENVFLAAFNTVEQAAEFCEKLTEDGLNYKTKIVPFE